MLDFNLILVFLMISLSAIAACSGLFLVVRSFFRFRIQINHSMNMDLEVVRVVKINKKESGTGTGGQMGEAWKEEIGAMEQLLTTLSKIKISQSFFVNLFYDTPCVSFEIANPSSSEEISFYVAISKKFRETIEKQIHSYFPNASIEKISDYTIFSPGSFTSSAVLELKNKYALPIKTYASMNSDPLNELSNSLSKFKTEEEGAAIQLVIAPAKKGWQTLGKTIAHKMQQGKRLKDVHSNSLFLK